MKNKWSGYEFIQMNMDYCRFNFSSILHKKKSSIFEFNNTYFYVTNTEHFLWTSRYYEKILKLVIITSKS